ncbi:MAG: FHA domain-containing protein [Planctomycetota bacterium]|nr:FHA domain-containing protein [Planctomycetota bacterium]
MPRIYVLSGPDLGRNFDVRAGATFGRTAECQVTLRDPSVSRVHARLEEAATGWRVVDTGSRNGLFVRDERVPAAEIEDGDEFRLGEVLLRFRADAPSAKPAGSAPEPAPVAAPEIQFHARGASRAAPAEEPADIELEGDWSEPVAAPQPAARPRAPEGIGHVAAGAPTATPRSVANDQRARKLAAAGVAPTGRTGAADARGILQFNRVAQQEGLLRQELDQQPTWLRFAVVGIVLAVVAALAWLGYQAATATKARLAPSESVEDEGR